MSKVSGTNGLYNPRNGGQAIRIESLSVGRKPFEPARTNYFSMCLINAGSGTFWPKLRSSRSAPIRCCFFCSLQHIRFTPVKGVHGEVIHFHSNFLCVETFHAEVGCSGVLFNDPYDIPVVTVGC